VRAAGQGERPNGLMCMRRHDLVRLSEPSWSEIRAGLGGVGLEPLVAGWADRGWPFVARARDPGEADVGVPLVLLLPPASGSTRIFFTAASESMISVDPPPLLLDAAAWSPNSWRTSLQHLSQAAQQHVEKVRVFGSLAWASFTGLNYIGPGSDLGLLWPLAEPQSLPHIISQLVAIVAAAPMRIDVELVRPDGLAANWREFQTGESEITVVSLSGVARLRVDEFLEVRPGEE
jgi:phosphoribosyl-dephospho-CoA transferase